MTRSENDRSDKIPICLFIVGFLLAACLLTHDPRRPYVIASYPNPSPTNNLLGYPGELLACLLFDVFGNATYVLLAGWFGVTVWLYQGVTTRKIFQRFLGLLIALASMSLFFECYATEILVGSRFGAGGSLGAYFQQRLNQNLSSTHVLLLLISLGLLSFCLIFDQLAFALFKDLSRALVMTLRTFANIGRLLVVFRRKPKQVTQQAELTSKDSAVAVVSKKSAKSKGLLSADEPLVLDAEDIPIQYPGHAPEDEHNEHDSPSGSHFKVVRPGKDNLPVSPESTGSSYDLPSMDLLEEPDPFPFEEHDQQLRENAVLLEKVFKDFDINVKVVGINTGPVITQYELALETGLRLHKVTNLADDVALNLKVANVRMVAPIPGKNTVGVEVPNEHRAIVRLREVMLTMGNKGMKMKIPLFLGKDSEGRPLVYDLAEMPHLLIAGRTGTGKSVCLNSVILSLLMTKTPQDVKLLMIDPKGNEFTEYGHLPHLMHPVVTDMKKAESILSWAVEKMEQRYELLSRARVRNIASYNDMPRDKLLSRIKATPEEEENIPEQLPYIVIIVDEMADLMIMMKREVEGHIIRLAQKSRAAGIHLVVATQKPTVDVITGLIKSNLPARICFQVASRSDSRVVLDEMGADKLLGKGDMLFLVPGTSTLVRAQGTYASDEEITRVVETMDAEPEFAEELLKIGSEDKEENGDLHQQLKSRDDVYEQAIEIVVREGRGSVSLLQRALGIGYGRAARLIDFMAEDGIVGGYRGSSAREVLVTPEDWDSIKSGGSMHQGA